MTYRSVLRAAVAVVVVATGLVVLQTPAAAAKRGPYYYMPGHASGMCMDNPKSNPNNNIVMTIYTCSRTAANQQWWEEDTATGYVQIRNLASGKCLTVRNRSTARNEPVIQFDCNGGTNAQWSRIKVFDGDLDYYYLKNRNSGLCLHVKNAWVGNGSPLLQHDCANNGKDNNWWTWYYPYP